MTKKMVDAAGSEARLSDNEDIFKATSTFGDATSGDDANISNISDYNTAEHDINHDNQKISEDNKFEETTSEDPLEGKSMACNEVYETGEEDGFNSPSCLDYTKSADSEAAADEVIVCDDEGEKRTQLKENTSKIERNIKKRMLLRSSVRLASRSLGSVLQIEGDEGKIVKRRSARLEGKRKMEQKREKVSKKKSKR